MLKIGALSFVNSLPFFQPFAEKKIDYDGQFLYGSPTQINGLLESGQVDIGLISSASFIANRDRYILLTNLGIGAHRRVISVCLFTKTPPEELNGKQIAIPDSSATSVLLLKVLCKHFWHVQQHFVEYPKEISLTERLSKSDAALIIGDECLTTKTPDSVQVVDLANVWYRYTGRPFVFAVFATRCDIWMQEPELVREFHQKLFLSYDYSQRHFDEILTAASEKTHMSKESLMEYYKSLDYYLESEHFQGLEHFARLKNDQIVPERVS